MMEISTNKLETLRKNILPVIIEHKFASPFIKPVDYVSLNLPEYPAIIKAPLDLSEVKFRLKQRSYHSAAECINDLYQIFINTYVYNAPGTDIVDLALSIDRFLTIKLMIMNEEEEYRLKIKKKVKVAVEEKESLITRNYSTFKTTNKLEVIKKIILPTLMNNPDAEYFLEPVDSNAMELLDYSDIIKDPIDLSIVNYRLTQRYYLWAEECINDLYQMFINTYIYYSPGTYAINNALSLDNFVRMRVGFLDEDEEKHLKLKKKIKTEEYERKLLLDETPGAIMNTNKLKILHKIILPTLMINTHAWPFTQFVNYVSLNIPDYPKIIKSPIDLSEIKSRLDQDYYNTADECVNDVYHLFNNCYIFNSPGETIVHIALYLETIFTIKVEGLYGDDEFQIEETEIEEESLKDENLQTKYNIHNLKEIKDKILPLLMKDRYGYPFSKAKNCMSLGDSDYSIIIKDPMYFHIVESKLTRGRYHSLDECLGDLQHALIDVYIYYSPGTLTVKFALRFQNIVSRIERLMKRIRQKTKEKPVIPKIVNESPFVVGKEAVKRRFTQSSSLKIKRPRTCYLPAALVSHSQEFPSLENDDEVLHQELIDISEKGYDFKQYSDEIMTKVILKEGDEVRGREVGDSLENNVIAEHQRNVEVDEYAFGNKDDANLIIEEELVSEPLNLTVQKCQKEKVKAAYNVNDLPQLHALDLTLKPLDLTNVL